MMMTSDDDDKNDVDVGDIVNYNEGDDKDNDDKSTV